MMSIWVFISAQAIKKDEELNLKRIVKKNVPVSRFNKIVYFQTDFEKGFKMIADELVMSSANDLSFTAPVGAFYKGMDYAFNSKKGAYVAKNKTLNLVEGIIENKEFSYQANTILYNTDKKRLIAVGDVITKIDNKSAQNKISLTGSELEAYIDSQKMVLKDNVEGIIKPYLGYKRKIRFNTDELTYLGESSEVALKGNVALTNGNFNVTAHRGEIFLENQNKKLKYFALYDDIKFKESFRLRDGSKVTRKAFAEKMEGIDLDREVILTGAPRVLQGTDVIRGYKITLRENIDVIEVDDSQSLFQFKQQKRK